MATVVGRLRPDPLFHYKFLALGHNTIRGAAGGSLLNAELIVAQGYLGAEAASLGRCIASSVIVEFVVGVLPVAWLQFIVFIQGRR